MNHCLVIIITLIVIILICCLLCNKNIPKNVNPSKKIIVDPSLISDRNDIDQDDNAQSPESPTCDRVTAQYGQDIPIFSSLPPIYVHHLSADGTVLTYVDRTSASSSYEPRVYEFDGSLWAPKGDQLELIASLPGSSPRVNDSLCFLSDDGNTLVISTLYSPDFPTPGLFETAYVMDYVGGSWIQRGQNLTAPGNPEVGQGGTSTSNQVTLTPDGNTLVVVWDSDIVANGPNYDVDMTAEVYDWNSGLNQWVIRGTPQLIIEYTMVGPSSTPVIEPWEVSISGDGNTFIVSEAATFLLADPGSRISTSRVFQWTGTEWIRRGQDLIAETLPSEFLPGFSNLPPRSANITTDGNTVFNGTVHDWDETNNIWVDRPRAPNYWNAQSDLVRRYDASMSYDGKFVASTYLDPSSPTGFYFEIYEWKESLGEWVLCFTESNFLAFGCPFSRDGNHFMLYGAEAFVGVPTVYAIRTFTFTE